MAPPDAAELPTVLLVAPGTAAGEWLGALDRAGEPARSAVVETLAEAERALRDPVDLVVVWDDEAGERGRRAAEALAGARSPAPLVVVAHPEAPADAVPASASAVLGREGSGRLPAELRRALAAAERDMRVALSERIAHDLSNLLAPIPLAVQLLRRPGSDGAPAGTIDAVDLSARRAMAAVRELSALATAPDREPVRIGARHLLVVAARAWMEGEPRIGVVTEYPPDLGRVRVRTVPLARVLWCCTRRALDRAGGAAPGDLLFSGRKLPGEVELRVGWVAREDDAGEPPADRTARAVESGVTAGLAGAAVAAGGTVEALAAGAGFRLLLPEDAA